MKIISKFQDYYDCGVAYGIDEKIYFKRETTQEKEKYTSEFSNWDRRLLPEKVLNGEIHFCGKLYKYKVRLTPKLGKPLPAFEFNRGNCDFKYYYNTEEYHEDYPEVKKKNKWKSWRVEVTDAEFFKVKTISDDEFIERGVPYFKGNTNLPILKTYQFHKAVDPMTAFQEISMYLGRLNHQEDGCEIEDKYRMKGHGMDCMSFRKEGKKTKKCK